MRRIRLIRMLIILIVLVTASLDNVSGIGDIYLPLNESSSIAPHKKVETNLISSRSRTSQQVRLPLQSSVTYDNSVQGDDDPIELLTRRKGDKGSSLLIDFTNETFISKWDTSLISSGSSDSTQIALPLLQSGTYNFTVDWGDGINNIITERYQAIHTYKLEGVYTISIEGILIGWQFKSEGDKLKIKEISQWGSIRLGNLGGYFEGSSNLNLTATDDLNLLGTTILNRAFYGCENLGIIGSMNTWDVSSVTSMNSMFEAASSFNQPISNWDVFSVTDMNEMFYDASSFNQPIGDWIVSSVTDMSAMFKRAFSFDQFIGSWDVSSVTSMQYMFSNAYVFNKPVDNWNVSSVTDMGGMFYEAASFNQPIGVWDVSSVSMIWSMFGLASSFNQPISNWDVSSVNSMSHMFYDATSFNQSIGNWNVSSVTDMGGLFFEASSFNQPIGDWDVSSVTSMHSMFEAASSFNQLIGNWDVSSVTDMNSMFGSIALSTTNYDNLLAGWADLNLQSGIRFDGGMSQYSNSDARQYIIDTFDWIIVDGGLVGTTSESNFLHFSLFLISFVSMAFFHRLRINKIRRLGREQ